MTAVRSAMMINDVTDVTDVTEDTDVTEPEVPDFLREGVTRSGLNYN